MGAGSFGFRLLRDGTTTVNGSGVLAQAVDNTGRDVTLIIVGLLVVAGLLAALTVWYWRYTDPKKRIHMQSVGELLDEERPGAEIGETAGATARGAARPEPERPSDRDSLDSDDGADEWLRLTGPRGRAIR